jgi:hypothetical protein
MPRTAIDRFVRFLPAAEDAAGCWNWQGTLSAGYAIFKDGRNWPGHRWSYEYHVAPIPEGLQIDHLCNNRACVNPWHLEPVSRSENARRGWAEPNNLKYRKTPPPPIPTVRGYDWCVA